VARRDSDASGSGLHELGRGGQPGLPVDTRASPLLEQGDRQLRTGLVLARQELQAVQDPAAP
jgi:hypothetical protein